MAIDARSLDRQIEAEAGVWQGWVDQLVRVGPEAHTAAQEVAASAARYYALQSLRRNHFPPTAEDGS